MGKLTKKKDSKWNSRSKGKGREKKDWAKDKPEVVKSPTNDPDYYGADPQLIKDSASYSYGWPLGNNIRLGRFAPEVNKAAIPGVMVIHTSPTFGWAVSPNSPINLAARNIYSFVRHANSGHANYDAPDLMLYLCAMDSCYSFMAWLKRIYGVYCTRSNTNHYYPRDIIQAMGVDYDDLDSNLADFRAFINIMAAKIGSMVVPANMRYIKRHIQMYSGLYMDSDQDKAQTYFFNPHGFYKFELQNDAGALKFEELLPIPTHYPNKIQKLLTFKDLRDYANVIFDPVVMSEDFNIMSGDILKAYGPTETYKVDGITDVYTVLPAYDAVILDQIQNTSLIGDWAFAPSLVQSEHKSHLLFNPQFFHPFTFDVQGQEHPGQNVFLANRFVTFTHGDITPMETMEATRYTNICTEFNEEGTYTYLCKTIGAAVAHAATIYYRVRTVDDGENSHLEFSNPIYIGNTTVFELQSNPGREYFSSSDWQTLRNALHANLVTAGYTTTAPLEDTLINLLVDSPDSMLTKLAKILNLDNFQRIRDRSMQDNRLIQQLSQFNRHPPVALTTGIQDADFEKTQSPAAYGRFTGEILDVNYNTVIDEDDLMTMAEVELMSEFDVTQYGRAAQ